VVIAGGDTRAAATRGGRGVAAAAAVAVAPLGRRVAAAGGLRFVRCRSGSRCQSVVDAQQRGCQLSGAACKSKGGKWGFSKPIPRQSYK